jgi:pteridine reductase
MDLTDKVALVTGAGQRVGRAIALGLAERGASILVHYRSSEDEARETLDDIRALGVRAEAFRADLGQPEEIAALFEAVVRSFGRVDVLVNSASTFRLSDVLDVTVEDWNRVMNVNLRAPFLCSQHAARLMLDGGSGVIVNIADIAGQVPWVRFPHHSVSKAGVVMLTKVFAKSLGPEVRVNAVVPGPVLKPEDMSDDRWERLGAMLPLRRTGDPGNVVQAVLALVENDFMTGAVLNVDGGDSLIGSVDFW